MSPLRILVTRPDPQGSELCQWLRAAGMEVLHYPTIRIAPYEPEAFDHILSLLSQQDWLIFTSPQAVFQSTTPLYAHWPKLPNRLNYAAIGLGTASAMKKAGFSPVLYPEEWNSEGLLALPAFQNVRGKSITIIKGHGGRTVLGEQLCLRGATVLTGIAYQRTMPAGSALRVIQSLENDAIDRIVCASFECVQNLKNLVGPLYEARLFNTPLIVPAERIKILARGLGFRRIWVASNASHAAILDRCK